MSDLNISEDLGFSPVKSVDERSVDDISRRGTLATRSAASRHHNGLVMQLPSGNEALVSPSARRTRHLFAKRILDLVASSLGLLVLLPLFVVVAVAIKSGSKGPVFFRQEREGRAGKSFMALKFRSMAVDKGDASGVEQTVQDDPRVTPIGRILRKTSIDELPQLINVLFGDMSLVGPRPHVFNMRAAGILYRDLVPYYDARLEMLPGLTGWAQANGLRGPTQRADRAHARIDHDIAYIQNFSIWLDMQIIVKTIRHEFIGGSAD